MHNYLRGIFAGFACTTTTMSLALFGLNGATLIMLAASSLVLGGGAYVAVKTTGSEVR